MRKISQGVSQVVIVTVLVLLLVSGLMYWVRSGLRVVITSSESNAWSRDNLQEPTMLWHYSVRAADLLYLQTLINTYQSIHGTCPATLQDLPVPKIPRDPFNGNAYGYHNCVLEYVSPN